MTGRWTIRRARRRDGSLYEHAPVWDVYRPDGTWDGTLETWAEAIQWATDPIHRIEHFVNT